MKLLGVRRLLGCGILRGIALSPALSCLRERGVQFLSPLGGEREGAARWLQYGLIALAGLSIVACSTQPTKPANAQKPVRDLSLASLQADGVAREVVMVALGLLDVGYQFGGANPEAGLDCSGMVRFIYKQAAGVELPHSAAALAQRARPVGHAELQAGDLVFFNTQGYPFSHVGIYLGDNKFVHAPSSRGKVRVESLDSPYFAQRFQGGRTLFAGG